MKNALLWSLALILVISVYLVGCKIEDKKEASPDEPKNSEQETGFVGTDSEPEIEPIDYEIVEVNDLSMKALGDKLLSEYTTQEIEKLPIAKKMSYRVLVSPKIKEEQVKPTVEKIINDLTSSDGDIDSIHLLLYSDREIIRSYDVAMATWEPRGGIITPEIAQKNNRKGYFISLTIKENLEEYLKTRSESEDKFGFTEDERRKIFIEVVIAEDNAMREADEIYPADIMKNIDKWKELEEKYEEQIRKKYGITEEVQIAIVVEGIKKNWPLK